MIMCINEIVNFNSDREVIISNGMGEGSLLIFFGFYFYFRDFILFFFWENIVFVY